MFFISKALPALKRTALKLLAPLQWIIFKYQTLKLRVNHAYIKDIYSRLVQLDWIDFVEIGPYQVQAFGLTAYIKRGDYEFTMSENMQNKQLYVHEKERGRWVEVYRTNRLLSSTHFISELSWLDKEMEKVAASLPESDATTV